MTYREMNNLFGASPRPYSGNAQRAQQEAYNEAAARMNAQAQASMNEAYQRMFAEAMIKGVGAEHFRAPPPPPPRLPTSHWSSVLGVPPTATIAEIKSAYRAKAKIAHPDHGGSETAIKQINAAKDQAMKERKSA